MKMIFLSSSKTFLFLFTLYFSPHNLNAAILTHDTSYKKLTQTTVIYKEKFLLLNSAANNLTVAEYQRMSSKKLSLKNKLRYFFIKHELKTKGKHNGLLSSAEGFALGLFLGPIGVLLAYLFSKDKKLRHAAIAGGIISILLFFLFIALVAASLNNIPFDFVFPM